MDAWDDYYQTVKEERRDHAHHAGDLLVRVGLDSRVQDFRVRRHGNAAPHQEIQGRVALHAKVVAEP